MSVVPTNIDPFITKFLIGPVEEFLSRPKKDLRSELVGIGYMLYASQKPDPQVKEDLSILSSMLEWIHDGSLIVDDIQDDSIQRRGNDCLHRLYGVPCALNAANWMYFEALKKLNQLSLDEFQKIKMYELTLEMMSLAHQGQAIDLMVSTHEVSREEIYSLGIKSHDLKSGVIFALALKLGALLADPYANLERLSDLGLKLGASLQRFDDLGNLNLDSNSPKSLEDLRLGRPTWPMMYVARFRTEDDYVCFQMAIRELPDQQKLENFLIETNIWAEAFAMARSLHQNIDISLQEPFPGTFQLEGVDLLKQILKKVLHAYI